LTAGRLAGWLAGRQAGNRENSVGLKILWLMSLLYSTIALYDIHNTTDSLYRTEVVLQQYHYYEAYLMFR